MDSALGLAAGGAIQHRVHRGDVGPTEHARDRPTSEGDAPVELAVIPVEVPTLPESTVARPDILDAAEARAPPPRR